MQAFSLVAVGGDYSSLVVLGLPLVVEHGLEGMQALAGAACGLQNSGSVAVYWLSCSEACGILLGKGSNCVSCNGKRILYH